MHAQAAESAQANRCSIARALLMCEKQSIEFRNASLRPRISELRQGRKVSTSLRKKIAADERTMTLRP